jgi:ribose transport system ATP-binding protein
MSGAAVQVRMRRAQFFEASHFSIAPSFTNESMNNGASHPAIILENISKGFPGVQALENVSFAVEPGQVRALLGENGAGKSTLLKILSGIYRADAGQIVIEGHPVDLRTPKSARLAGIALIHQELQQVPELDVAQNMFLGAPLTRFGLFTDRMAMQRRAKEILAQLDSTIDVRSKIKNLRVAQRQIVEIAKALLGDARIIAMDEPTSSLTPVEFEKLVGVIERLKASGVAVIYVSHKLDEVFRVASQATVLRDGKLVANVDLSATNEDSVVGLMVGRSLDIPPHQSHIEDETVLSVQGMSRGRFVRDVSFDLRKGEVLGIAGLVGSGRTELVRLLAGVDRPTAGVIALHGKTVAFGSPRQAIAAGLALLPEDRKKEGIVPLRSVAINAALPSYGKLTRFGIIKNRQLRARVNDIARSVALRPHDIERAIRLFSGGNQQKAIICRWLMAGSEILIFDEPTRGIDVGAKGEIYRLIESLAAAGRSIIIVSSELPEVLRLSDTVIVMRAGALAGRLNRGELSEEAIMNLAVTGKQAA